MSTEANPIIVVLIVLIDKQTIPWLIFHVLFPPLLRYLAISDSPPPLAVLASFLDPNGISSLKAFSDASITATPDAIFFLLMA